MIGISQKKKLLWMI